MLESNDWKAMEELSSSSFRTDFSMDVGTGGSRGT